jgi:sodium transport system permease protein|tara:strand:- start:9087 stop:11303 length:2217 start_codon:yes stop_codon:yes gene_type:complete
MNWTNVKRIFNREIRDQLRDRRTLFTTLILPLMMYPILGLLMLQIAQFVSETSSKVQVIGRDAIADLPVLFDNNKFTDDHAPAAGKLLDLEFYDGGEQSTSEVYDDAKKLVDSDEFDAVIVFPADLQQYILALRNEVEAREDEGSTVEDSQSDDSGLKSAETVLPQGPQIVFNSVDDKSKIARKRIADVLESWQTSIKQTLFQAGNIPLKIADPIAIVDRDTAPEESRTAALWASIIPMLLLMWTLSGAFYPAVDLCAGEKERGTLETLLCGPAKRIEIVAGKLLTIMTFSFFTSFFNLVSIAFTGVFMIGRMMPEGSPLHEQLGSVPGWSILWSLVVLVPLVAMFSALALSAATFARSSKEGQYYMMPLLILCMPLMMISMIPSVELNLGTSLIPVAGAALLLRNLIESQFSVAIRFAFPVVASSMFCCYLALRWATAQFNSESVLFRESEKWDVKLWLLQLLKTPRVAPTAGMAISFALFVLILRFFANFLTPDVMTWQGLLLNNSVALILTVGVPAILAAVFLTNNLWDTLNIRRVSAPVLVIAVLLPFSLQPIISWFGVVIAEIYPMSPSMLAGLEGMEKMFVDAPWGWLLLAFAVVPAVFEELAFRGFMLSGLRSETKDWTAIFITAAFFGITHGILQQSLNAGMVGVLLGYVAVRTNSIIPTMIIHFLHNGLLVVVGKFSAILEWQQTLQVKYDDVDVYSPLVTVVGTVITLALLFMLHRLTVAKPSTTDTA